MATLTGNAFNLSKNENAVLQINGMSEVSFFLSTFNIPGMSTGTTPISNPFLEYQAPGSKLNFDEFELEILVDEEFASWNAIREWILEGNNGTTFSTKSITKRSGDIMITTNMLNPKYRISILNMFPLNMSSINIDLQTAEPVPLTFTATMQYERYTFDSL